MAFPKQQAAQGRLEDWKIGPGGRPAASTAPRIYDWGGDVHGAYMTPWYAMGSR